MLPKILKYKTLGVLPVHAYYRVTPFETKCKTFILKIDGTRNSFSPKFLGQSFALQHASDHIKNGFIFPFNHTVLLRRIRGRQEIPNTMIFTKFVEYGRGEFSTMISPQNLDKIAAFLFS